MNDELTKFLSVKPNGHRPGSGALVVEHVSQYISTWEPQV